MVYNETMQDGVVAGGAADESFSDVMVPQGGAIVGGAALVYTDLRYWLGNSTSWNDKNNWAGDSGGEAGVPVPVGGNTAIFDSGGSSDCTLDTTVAAIGGIISEAGYAGDIDLATYDVTGDNSADFVFDHPGILDMGTGTFTVTDGTFDVASITTFTGGTSKLVMAGTGNLLCKDNHSFWDLTFQAGCYTTFPHIAGQRCHPNHLLVVDGTVEVQSNRRLDIGYWQGTTATMGAAGKITGTGQFKIWGNQPVEIIRTPGDVIDIAEFYVTTPHITSCVIGPGIYDSTFTIDNNTSTARYWTPSAGTYTFTNFVFINTGTGDLSIESAPSTSVVVTTDFEMARYGSGEMIMNDFQSWEIAGDVFQTIGVATWNKGAGTITANGTGAQSWDFGGLAIEGVDVDKAAGYLVLAGDLTSDSFTLTDGTFDSDAYNITTGDATFTGTKMIFGSGTWTVSGDFDASSFSGNWDFKSSIIIVFTGVGKTWSYNATTRNYLNVTISGSINSTTAISTSLLVEVDLTVQAGATLTVSDPFHCDGDTTVAGLIDGPSNFWATLGSGDTLQLDGTGSIESNNLYCQLTEAGATLQPGTYKPTTRFQFYTLTSSADGTLETGTYIFDTGVHFTSGSGALAIKTVAGTNIEITGNVTRSGLNLAWTSGAGTITLNGTGDQNMSGWENQIIDHLVIDKATGTTTFFGNHSAQSLTITDPGTAVDFSTYTHDFFDGWSGFDDPAVDYSSASIYVLGHLNWPLIGGEIGGAADDRSTYNPITLGGSVIGGIAVEGSFYSIDTTGGVIAAGSVVVAHLLIGKGLLEIIGAREAAIPAVGSQLESFEVFGVDPKKLIGIVEDTLEILGG